MQRNLIIHNSEIFEYSLPDANEEVQPGIRWGNIYAFPSPAYWVHQIRARRDTNTSIKSKLGNTFIEEVGACLLGGHGIPAEVGLAAFQHLKSNDVFSKSDIKEDDIYALLKEPLIVKHKPVKYRFAKQKSQYLCKTLKILSEIPLPKVSDKKLRNWLTNCPGIGYKTASWIVRNWFNSDEVAILDIHILRAGILVGFFSPNLTVQKDYIKLENQYLSFCNALGVRAAELDAVVWYEMMSSQKTVRRLFNNSLSSTNYAHTHAN